MNYPFLIQYSNCSFNYCQFKASGVFFCKLTRHKAGPRPWQQHWNWNLRVSPVAPVPTLGPSGHRDRSRLSRWHSERFPGDWHSPSLGTRCPWGRVCTEPVFLCRAERGAVPAPPGPDPSVVSGGPAGCPLPPGLSVTLGAAAPSVQTPARSAGCVGAGMVRAVRFFRRLEHLVGRFCKPGLLRGSAVVFAVRR